MKQSSEIKFASNPVVAHRGAFKKNGFPENSIAALKEAIRLQCTGAEFDVWLSADDTLLINHDPHYNKLDIEKSSYASLAAVPLPNGETLPTLHQYLSAGKENNPHTRLVLEIKPSTISKERGKQVAEKVARMVQDLQLQNRIVYISFDYDILKKILEIDPSSSTQYLNGDIAPENLKKDGIAGIDYHISVFRKNPDWIEQAKKHKLLLNAWTVNNEADMKWLLSQGFHFITTNEPELLFALLTNRN